MQKSSCSVDYCVAREEFEAELHTVFGDFVCVEGTPAGAQMLAKTVAKRLGCESGLSGVLGETPLPEGHSAVLGKPLSSPLVIGGES